MNVCLTVHLANVEKYQGITVFVCVCVCVGKITKSHQHTLFSLYFLNVT